VRLYDHDTNKRVRDVTLYVTQREAVYLLEFLEFAAANPQADDHQHLRSGRDRFTLLLMTEKKLRSPDFADCRRICRGWVDQPVRRRKRKK
jgi:hypothetical protein